MDICPVSAVLLYWIWLTFSSWIFTFRSFPCSHFPTCQQITNWMTVPQETRQVYVSSKVAFSHNQTPSALRRSAQVNTGATVRPHESHALFSLQDFGCSKQGRINKLSLPDRTYWAIKCKQDLAVHRMPFLIKYTETLVSFTVYQKETWGFRQTCNVRYSFFVRLSAGADKNIDDGNVNTHCFFQGNTWH